MGNVQPFQDIYSSPVKGTQTPDSTPILRAATHPDELVEDFQEQHIENAWDLFMRGFSSKRQLPCVGYRPRSADSGESAPTYTWLTYSDFHQRALAIGTALLDQPGCMDAVSYPDEMYGPAQTLKPLGLFCKNRLEWLVCEQAANAYNFSIVPLYDTLGAEALEFILEKTRLATIGCSLECLPILLNAVEATKFVRYVLLFLDAHEQVGAELSSRMEKLGITSMNFNDIVSKKNQPTRPPTPGSLDSINTICYTSGTTGLPKGVLVTHRNVVGCAVGIMRGPISGNFALNATDSHISYLPLAHVLERLVCNVLLTMGASVGMYSGDQTKLLDDIRLLRPTVLVSVPRVYNRINDAVFRGASEKTQIQRYFFEKGMSRKLDRLRTNAATTDKLWDPLVFNKTKKLMGERLKWMISGGAPLDAAVQENMKVLFCAPLMEGYGLTETFGPAFLADPKDPVSGHVGGVLPCNEFKLQSVPEMNYLVTDTPPRGELLIRGKAVTPGYFRDADETRAALDADNWFRTGDIALVLPSGGLKIIDRRKNIFKLAQGEYIAPEKIEAIYLRAPLVSQIFVFGYSDENSLVAIVVPDPEASVSFAKKHPTLKSFKDFEQLCTLPEFKQEVMKEMDAAGKEAGLKGFEKVRAIELHTVPFSVENGLLTPSLKIKRHLAKLTFKADIDKMYAS